MKTVPLRTGSPEPVRENRYRRLKMIIQGYGRVLVAFSGGADSAFVLKVAREVLGRENVLAVIAKSPSLPESEFEAAREIAREIDAEFLVIETHELENPSYARNSTRRCYFCKSELYSHLIPIARERGIRFILNATNQDDLGDWRPGLEAALAYEVKSPLVHAGLGKEEIRYYSHELGLSTWSKPQAACLSSRIPFGTRVTVERLNQIEQAEAGLKELGFGVVRLRWFGERALIEVGPEETARFFCDSKIRQGALTRLKELGFKTIELEISGYRPGRFNPQRSSSNRRDPSSAPPAKLAGRAQDDGRNG